MQPAIAERPDHVPADRVVDVDIYALPGGETDPQQAWKDLDLAGPAGLSWSPRNGGHWIATSAELIWTLFADIERLSARQLSVPPSERDIRFIPNESDEPEHRYYRRILLPFLGPKQVRELSESVRGLAQTLIDGFVKRGTCEFMSEFARHLPMRIFLTLVDLPESDRASLVALAETGIRGRTIEERSGAQAEMMAYLQTWIDRRRAEPGTDMLSAIVHGTVGDRPMNAHEVMGEAADVMFGGLDTVASMMGFIMRFLATHPEHYRQLVDDPGRIPTAVEEMLRRHGVANVARQAIRDIEYQGLTIRAGDMVVIPSCLHGLDERHWDDPKTVDFDRPRQSHSTFGNGVHTCPGAGLARSEIKIMLEEWTKRIPAFGLAEDQPPTAATGSVNGMVTLNLQWRVD